METAAGFDDFLESQARWQEEVGREMARVRVEVDAQPSSETQEQLAEAQEEAEPQEVEVKKGSSVESRG